MKHLLILFLSILCLTACRTQLITSKEIKIFPVSNSTLKGVKGPNFQGTLFTEKYPFGLLFVDDIDSTKRFTLSSEELAEVETILATKLKSLNKNRPNQFRGNPVIHKNLKKYLRQYVGFIDTQGNKIVHVNFHWNHRSLIDKINDYAAGSDSRLNYNSNYSVVFDGGSYYWQINVNLTKKELTDLGVNGFG